MWKKQNKLGPSLPYDIETNYKHTVIKTNRSWRKERHTDQQIENLEIIHKYINWFLTKAQMQTMEKGEPFQRMVLGKKKKGSPYAKKKSGSTPHTIYEN